MTCPEPTVVLEYIDGRLARSSQIEIEDHIDACADCRRVIAELARATGGSLSTIPPGARFGRYLVIERLGEGAMGVVYTAYDSQLDRRVALKLLRPDAEAPAQADARARLLREAQAMARLQHPNVISVYDIGEVNEQAFLAMEFVDGCTLEKWLRKKARPWREVLALFVAAGRGLAAAHAVGLIHRDFKPDNVLVGKDGRVRVTDFGLARAVEASAQSAAPASAPTPARPAAASLTLTQSTTLVGTPAYIAPEQYRGEPADARSDQFSFCAALYEGLYGQRPFAGETVAELVASVQSGRVAAPPAQSRVPAWLRRAVVRGLSDRPAERHPSMDELLGLLSRDRGARVLRWGLASLVLATLVVGLWGYRHATRSRLLLCSGAERKLAGVWDAPRRAAVREAFGASRRPYADDAWRSVERSLNAYSDAWATMRRQACEATRLRAQQSEELLDLRMQCLDSRLEELRALVDLLAHAEPAVTERAVQAAGALTSLSDCANAAALMAPVPPPSDPQSVRKVDQLRRQLAQAKAESDAGRYAQGLTLAKKVAADAEALRYAPLRAEALALRGDLEDKAGDAQQAQQTLEEALLSAEAGRHDRAKADAWIRLVWVVGFSRARHDEGRLMARQAAATVERLGQDQELLARLENNLGLVARAQGKYDEAAAHLQRALELREKQVGPDHPDVTVPLSGLGGTYLSLGKYQEALGYYRRVIAIREQTLGQAHPDVAKAENNLALLYKEMGRYDEALRHQQRAISIWQAAVPGDHPNLGSFFDNEGVLLRRLGRYAEALADHRRACEILSHTKGPEHPGVALCLNNIGLVFQSQKRWQEALAYHTRVLAMVEKVEGPEHPDAAMAHGNLGQDYKALGRLALAEVQLRRAIEIRNRTAGPDHPETIDDALSLAEVLEGQGRRREAVPQLEIVASGLEREAAAGLGNDAADLLRFGKAAAALGQSNEASRMLQRAVVLLQAKPEQTLELADARFAFAKLLWQRNADRSRAQELAQAARAAYARAGRSQSLGEVDGWLAARARGGSTRSTPAARHPF
ncbi:MAG TPA: tetratricopeptide repeat protein [Polyangia bacterium]|nr:tetratricopeptide repeat protein [Polyangia bacterium]